MVVVFVVRGRTTLKYSWNHRVHKQPSPFLLCLGIDSAMVKAIRIPSKPMDQASIVVTGRDE
jgi:hypothetical protein